ncbi:MAG: transposase [Planctomycetes bacterium]|nr:transposase [Planctomycetota bacterium]
MRREGIRHITSRPHHPQTLGKIEACWGHFKREFLKHALTGSLEETRGRIRHWVNYYNFQRPTKASIGPRPPSGTSNSPKSPGPKSNATSRRTRSPWPSRRRRTATW